MLPQFLAMLGVVFTAAGVGEVVADAIAKIVPDGNQFAGVLAYCVGMALFTAVVGNAFAAFTVITTGIGVPFVIALGGDPVIAGALAMTAGFCGTLVTPMAANFNALPVALLRDEGRQRRHQGAGADRGRHVRRPRRADVLLGVLSRGGESR